MTFNLVEESVKSAIADTLDDQKQQFGTKTTAIGAADNVDLKGKIVVIGKELKKSNTNMAINLVEESVKVAIAETIDEQKQEFCAKITAIEAVGNTLLDLKGKIAVITGCETEIGKITARVLAFGGAKVYMLCRNMEKASQAKAYVLQSAKKANKSAEIVTMCLDLSSLKAVNEFAAKFIALNEKIDFLINNASVMAFQKYTESADGIERQFAVNNLAHYYLTMLLLPILIKNKARIIRVSSRGHMRAPKGNEWIDELLKSKSGPSKEAYDNFGTPEYAYSNMCSVLFAQTLDRKYGHLGITSVAIHPGDVSETQQSGHVDKYMDKMPKSVCASFCIARTEI